MHSSEHEEVKVQAESEVKVETTSLTSKITSYLRWSGSILIILSATSFMIQGNEGLLPAYRYWAALAFTTLLCGGGLTCAYLFKETKGARIFFGLGTAFLTVQVSQVGAMIYGYLNGQNALQPSYTWLQFMDVSPTTIAIDFVLTGMLLLLVSYAGFSILARKHFKILLTVFVVGNAVFMLPIRDAYWIPAMLGALIVVLRKVEFRLHQDNIMKLPEGMAARAIIWLPAMTMMGRSLLHPMSFLLAIVMLGFVAVCALHDVKRYAQSRFVIYICQWIGTAAALATWLVLADQLPVGSIDVLTVYILPLSAILFVLSDRVDFHARLYRLAASLTAFYITYNAMVEHHFLAPVFSLATGIALSIAGLKYREKVPFFVGNVCFAGGLLFYCRYAIELYEAAPWVSSIALGLVVLLLASYLENKQNQIVQKSKYYFKGYC